MTKDIALASGSTLKVTLSPFAVSKALYQAVLEELKTLKLDPDTEFDTNLIKDVICTGFSSKKIENALNECLKRALYNGVHITEQTFEPAEAREDYMQVCLEVAYLNILPFIKNLSQQYALFLEKLPKNQ